MSLEDKAQEHEAMMWTIANTPRAQRTYAEGEPGYGPAECADCDAPMPALRRSMGKTRCTECTEALDMLRRRGLAR